MYTPNVTTIMVRVHNEWKCDHCGRAFKKLNSLYMHLAFCPIRRLKRMGVLDWEVSLSSKCPWFEDGNPYLEMEKSMKDSGTLIPPPGYD